jgi:hypothetical protein
MTQIVNKLDGGAFPLDGFDNDPNFQMVPLGGGMRDVVFTTARSPAVLKFTSSVARTSLSESSFGPPLA